MIIEQTIKHKITGIGYGFTNVYGHQEIVVSVCVMAALPKEFRVNTRNNDRLSDVRDDKDTGNADQHHGQSILHTLSFFRHECCCQIHFSELPVVAPSGLDEDGVEHNSSQQWQYLGHNEAHPWPDFKTWAVAKFTYCWHTCAKSAADVVKEPLWQIEN